MKKQVDALRALKPNTQESTIKNMIPEDILNDDAKNELNKIKETEKTVDREKLIDRENQYTYSFKYFQLIKTFGRDIYNGKITFEKACLLEAIYQSNLLVEFKNFKEKTRKKYILKNLCASFDVEKAFESKMSPIKSKCKGLLNFSHPKFKILTPKQMLQRFQIALAQV